MNKNYLLLLFSILLLFSCKSEKKSYTHPAPGTDELKRVAIAQFSQESNSFSSVLTTERDFESRGLLYGQEIIDEMINGKKAISGALQACADLGEGTIEVVPILKANAMSGGPVERVVYEKIKSQIIDGLANQMPLDGVYLVLHGAMGVEGMRDPEGDILVAVRSVVGDEIPVAVSHDLHANITEKRAALADYIVGYKTNPHRDHFNTGYHSMKIMIETLQGKIDPVMEIRKIPMLTGGGMEVDLLPPMRKIFKWMKNTEKEDEVLALSNFMVHIWLDDEELGWTTVAVTDGNRALARSLADELALKDWAVKDVHMPDRLSAEEAVTKVHKKKIARLFGPLIICDSADAVGAGAPGENTHILKALGDDGNRLVSYIPLRDAEAAVEAYNHAVGDEITLTLGGKLDKVYNLPYTFSGTLISKTMTKNGKTSILKKDGTHVILTELSDSVSRPSYFKELDLNIWKADVIVVKNLFPFRYFFALYNRGTLNVETKGTTSVNVYELEYEKIPRPMHPLDSIETAF